MSRRPTSRTELRRRARGPAPIIAEVGSAVYLRWWRARRALGLATRPPRMTPGQARAHHKRYMREYMREYRKRGAQ